MTDEQGEVYAQFVAEELDREWRRRHRLDTRGGAVLATSAGLVGLAAALGLLGPIAEEDQAVAIRVGYLVAGVVIMAAAIAALIGGWLHSYKVLDANDIYQLLRENWEESSVTARNRVAYFRATTIDTLRKGSDKKARTLLVALVLQVVGTVALVTVAVAANWSAL